MNREQELQRMTRQPYFIRFTVKHFDEPIVSTARMELFYHQEIKLYIKHLNNTNLPTSKKEI